ncbi:uncharacterized protein LACBIDRAFT_315577 [Laccaria bicolor S238N-H82]|uniref:Predicted protein n=1 Tax=Laccaria bicolor (strain S238N-H82 / ATCC MYA-4686) TaxID=486041 RepID=B0D2P2_LACBS|nr:uncharacterized protein LACBIDRAFT_315577 [Laccaria bicolor S238N-H82]EDR10786.1 predicted protein [Laccaria bicolor S238N-H82]|eukprot:XP_001878087.1 predicted protein [Laccaria bicolor S238N-H82]
MISILCIALVALIVSLFLRYFTAFFSSTVHAHRSVASIRAFLHSPNKGIEELLTERAKANERLVEGMGLSNTFVSPDRTVHKAFTMQARELIKTPQARWTDFRHLTTQAIHAELANSESHGTLFDRFVQSVTLRVVLVGIMGVQTAVDSLDRESIVVVVEGITKLWSLSKKPSPASRKLLVDVKHHLRRLVLDEDTFPNPLNFVVPAWETLWRVVATAIAYTHDNPRLEKLFLEVYVNPKEEVFRAEGKDGVSVKGVVDETMRLHPPSRHISRVRPRLGWSWVPGALLNVMEKLWPGTQFQRGYADVEEIQRSSVWGEDAHVFDPARHSTGRLWEGQAETMSFSFGYGPLRCIAASWAPMAVAVISASIFDCLEGGEYAVVPGPNIGAREGWRGWRIESSSCGRSRSKKSENTSKTPGKPSA